MMTKGTILYVGGFELPDKNAAAHRVLSNGKILRELGYNVVFIDIDKLQKSNINVLETKKIIQGFECWSRFYPKSNNEWFKYLTNIESIKVICNQYNDVKAIIAYNFQAMALLRLRKYCCNQKIKIIGDCSEWYSVKDFNVVFKIIKGFDSFLRMRIVQKQLDGLIVISKYLENYYRHCHNVVRIPPLVDLNEDKWNIKPNEFTDNKTRFVYSGDLSNKNKDKINFLIEVLYELKDYESYIFTVVGITAEQYIEDYKNHEQLLDCLGNKVQFYGRLTHNDSIQHLKQSDFSIFIREKSRLTKAGFPTKFVESINCGIPVITTNSSDLEDYIIEGNNGFIVATNDKKDLDLTLRKISEMSSEEIKIMKRNCFDSKVFDYKNYVTKMKDFLNNIFIYK